MLEILARFMGFPCKSLLQSCSIFLMTSPTTPQPVMQFGWYPFIDFRPKHFGFYKSLGCMIFNNGMWIKGLFHDLVTSQPSYFRIYVKVLKFNIRFITLSCYLMLGSFPKFLKLGFSPEYLKLGFSPEYLNLGSSPECLKLVSSLKYPKLGSPIVFLKVSIFPSTS